MADHPEREEVVLEGIAASPGVAHGHPFVLLQKELDVPIYQVDPSKRNHEVTRFEDALMETRQQVATVRSEVALRLGEDEARIFDAHLLVLEDKVLINETIREHEESGYNIEYCFKSVSDRFIEAFESLEDEYIKERASDIRDVAKRVLRNLLGHACCNILELSSRRIIVSEDITPSEAAELEKNKILGIVTNAGSRTSHIVIMARSIGIPAVVGLHDATDTIENDDYLLIDGYDGLVIINPSEQTLFRYGQLKKERQHIEQVYRKSSHLPAETKEGVRVEAGANIGGLEDCEPALKRGAEAVGLFRTEALFIRHDRFPTEEEQFQVYHKVASAMKGCPVIIRTLDLGGDKQMDSLYHVEEEENPFLGFRAIRFCLEHRSLFKDQLRAILRATAYGEVRVMFPMISGLQELLEAKAVLEEAKKELKDRGAAFESDLQVGVMIEIPSAAVIADVLASHCDFFSIGTNDLIQYLLAVDRVNDRVAHLYEPTHPAVIRTLSQIITAANDAKIKVGVCGELAADLNFVPLLVGMGVDSLSASAGSLPEIKHAIRQISMKEVKDLTKGVLKEQDPQKILTTLEAFKAKLMGEMPIHGE